jgi:nitrogen regulatory protein P-II 1
MYRAGVPLKQIEAIIRKEKFPDVDRGLREIGVGGLTVSEGVGRGRARETETVNVRGKWTFTHERIHRTKISIVVKDEDVKKVVDAVVANASTGSIGDGKVFVIPLEKAMDIGSADANDDTAFDLMGNP